MNNTPTIVNSSNLSSWFSISDADGISSWSGNTLTVKGVSGNERVKLTALVDMAISFDYTTTSFCKISLKGQYICDTDEDGSYSGTLLAGQSFHCYFSNTTVSETCTYSNIACTKMEKKVCYVGVDGKAKQVKKIYTGVENVGRNIKKGYVGVGNVARVFFESIKPLSEYPVDSIVYLPENNILTAFIVAKHDYESDLNGSGRTLLVRQDCYDQRVWHTSQMNTYNTSNIDSWLNSSYKALFNADIQNGMGNTTIKYAVGNGNTTINTMSRSVFLLSIREYGISTNTFYDGTAITNAKNWRLAKNNGTGVQYWTRTPNVTSTYPKQMAVCVNPSGSGVRSTACTESYWSRPAFTFPSTALFNGSSNEFIGLGG